MHFYTSLLDAPFLGNEINFILPGSMLALCILFVVLSYCKYEKKAVTLIKRWNAKLDKVKSVSDDSPLDSVAQKTGKIERLYKGEIAYLKELKQTRERTERREKMTQGKKKFAKKVQEEYYPGPDLDRLLQFDNNMQAVEQLERRKLSLSSDEED